MVDCYALGLMHTPRFPWNQIQCRLQKSFRRDCEPWSPVCIYTLYRNHHILTLKIQWPMSVAHKITLHALKNSNKNMCSAERVLESGKQHYIKVINNNNKKKQ